MGVGGVRSRKKCCGTGASDYVSELCIRGCSSVGRALPCQGRCRAFESRHPLHFPRLWKWRISVGKIMGVMPVAPDARWRMTEILCLAEGFELKEGRI